MTTFDEAETAWREWEIQYESNKVLAARVDRLAALAAKHGASQEEIKWTLREGSPPLRSAGVAATMRALQVETDRSTER